MEQKIGRIPVMGATVLLALAAYLLRLNQLAAAFDDAGIRTGKGVVLFTVFTVAAVALFAVYSRSLRGRKKYTAIAGTSLKVLAVGSVAALLMGSSGLVLLGNPALQGDRIIAAGSIVTAVCWAVTAIFRYQGKKVHAVLFLIPGVFFVAELIFLFRFWTRDPVLLDYCYDLFAMICVMCGVFHLGGFAFGQGSRRLTVFFSMCGVFFCAAAMADGSAASALGYGASAAWLLTNLWLLLRPGRQKAQ